MDNKEQYIGEIAIFIQEHSPLASLHSRDLSEDLYEAGYTKRNTGEWIERVEKLTWCEDDVEVYYDCSCCGTHNFAETPYCPNCGAIMIKEEREDARG